MIKIININKDFSKFPSGRFYIDGPYSGERFRKEFLLPALKDYDVVEIYLDGTLGYSSAFLKEAFGGLYEKSDKIKLFSFDENLIQEIKQYYNTVIA
jgi:hypothetical protein